MKVYHVDGETFFLKEMIAIKKMEEKEPPSNICGLSQETIKENDEIVLIANNFKVFPNKIVLLKYVDLYGVDESIRMLKKRYNEYLSMKEEYKEWFNY